MPTISDVINRLAKKRKKKKKSAASALRIGSALGVAGVGREKFDREFKRKKKKKKRKLDLQFPITRQK